MALEVQIRRHQPADAEPFFAAIVESKAHLRPWSSWCHDDYSLAEATAWLELQPAAFERDEAWNFAILDAQGAFLGGVGIHRIDLKNSTAELGYWVRASAIRRGVAIQATRQLCHWCFSERGLHRLEIIASVENLASQRVAARAGAVREGILRERILLHGRRHDCVLFSILNRAPQA